VQRAVTAVVAGWCVARLSWVLAQFLYARLVPSAGASEYDSGGNLLATIIPIVAATAGFIAAVAVVRNLIPDSSLRSVQIFDAIGVVLSAWWLVAEWQSQTMRAAPPGILEIELRAPKELLTDKNVAKHVEVYFGKGRATETKSVERIREEGGAAILPVEMEIYEHRGWSVVVRRNTDTRHNFWDRYWFDLPMAEEPAGDVAWSGWIGPAKKQGWDVANDVAVRARWVVR
jgi:hypothetical protein